MWIQPGTANTMIKTGQNNSSVVCIQRGDIEILSLGKAFQHSWLKVDIANGKQSLMVSGGRTNSSKNKSFVFQRGMNLFVLFYIWETPKNILLFY